MATTENFVSLVQERMSGDYYKNWEYDEIMKDMFLCFATNLDLLVSKMEVQSIF